MSGNNNKTRKCKRYTQSEINFIKDNYKTMPVKDIANYLNRSEKSIRAKMEHMNLRLSTLKRNDPFMWDDDSISYLKKNYKTMSDKKIGDHVGCSKAIVLSKRKKLGLEKKSTDPYVCGEYVYQYINNKRVPLHRYVMEQKIGRELTDEERVHHIDGDKTNYKISNLYLCKNRSEHMAVHKQLEKVSYKLIRNGLIKFNNLSGEYYV